MSASQNGDLTWFKVGPTDLLVEGRITTVQAGHSAVCLTRTDKGYGAISNRCAHQGGPLGDGFLQNGYVVCPWHAWEYDPHTGASHRPITAIRRYPRSRSTYATMASTSVWPNQPMKRHSWIR